jgi:threonine dehydratase
VTAGAVTPDLITEARTRLSGRVHRTPTTSAASIGDRVGARLFYKCENLQKTGSFKVRGALNLIQQLNPTERERGVVAISAGNHAQAVAWAARATGIRATVVMPAAASAAKVEASRGYGAEVILHGDVFQAFDKAHQLERERGLTFVHPFDDARVIAGAGTVGAELVEEIPDLDVVIVPVGGGGLISGIAVAVKAARPQARVYGVEPLGAAAMRGSLDRGEPIRLERVDTIADGLAAPMAGKLAFEIVRSLVDDVVTVTDDEIRTALRLILERAKLVVEPSGAAATAALLAGRIPEARGATVTAVLSGGNVTTETLTDLLSAR